MKKFLLSLTICLFIFPTVINSSAKGAAWRLNPQTVHHHHHHHRHPTYIVVPRYKTQKVTHYSFAPRPRGGTSRLAKTGTTTYYRQSGVSAVIIINPYYGK